MPFLDTLTPQAKKRLRLSVMRVHMSEGYRHDQITIEEIDKIIEALGQEVAEDSIRYMVNSGQIESQKYYGAPLRKSKNEKPKDNHLSKTVKSGFKV